MKKGSWLSVGLVLVILIFAGYYWDRGQNVDEETTKCIASKSLLYTQTGCPACERQEDLFGDSYKYLNTIDCLVQGQKCLENEITATPTWVIDGKKIIGVQSIEKLKELTGC